MNTMTMPGFTADNSLYRTSERYHMTGSSQGVELNARSVQPSAAIYQDGRFVCNGEVTANGFIDCYSIGGGLSEPPRLVCGPCIKGRRRCTIPGMGVSLERC